MKKPSRLSRHKFLKASLTTAASATVLGTETLSPAETSAESMPAVSFSTTSPAPIAQSAPNPIPIENALTGTTAWKLTTPVTLADRDSVTYRTRAIEGFASATSVNKGEWITFYVSTTSATFSLTIFRMGYYVGLGGRQMPNSSWSNLSGIDQATPAAQPLNSSLIECDWQATYLTASTTGSLQIPTTWVSGVYVAKLTASSGKQSYIFFVVRDDDRQSNYLVQCSVTTYQAYNGWGGKSVYPHNSLNGQVALKLSFNRPYMASASAGGSYGNGAGHFFTRDNGPDSSPPNQNYGYVDGSEYNMVRWLEAQGYDVSYCTNIDVHRDPALLLRHKGFLSIGHDEYWSRDMRLNVEHARDAGIHLAFFSGNTVWNMVRLEDDANGNPLRTMVHSDDKIYSTFPPSYAGNFLNLEWHPESLTGSTWTGGIWDVDLQLTSACPDWMRLGTGLSSGNTLGVKLGGYEVDGVQDDREQYCPPGMRKVLQSGLLISSPQRYAHSIFYTSQKSGATVFHASTVQWSWGLDSFTVDGVPALTPSRSARVSTAVQQVTANILKRFLDSTRMIADIADGEYKIQSASAFPQWLICTQLGVPNTPVVIYGYTGWQSGNNQAVWIVKKYTGGRLDCPGPYKAATNDAWYTIRNKQNGQLLVVGDSDQPTTLTVGYQNPIRVVGDQNGYWGSSSPSNLRKMWRIWRYTGHAGWHLIQNVATGQLLVVVAGGGQNAPVAVYGDNGGWGETEESPQKMWILTPS